MNTLYAIILGSTSLFISFFPSDISEKPEAKERIMAMVLSVDSLDVKGGKILYEVCLGYEIAGRQFASCAPMTLKDSLFAGDRVVIDVDADEPESWKYKEYLPGATLSGDSLLVTGWVEGRGEEPLRINITQPTNTKELTFQSDLYFFVIDHLTGSQIKFQGIGEKSKTFHVHRAIIGTPAIVYLDLNFEQETVASEADLVFDKAQDNWIFKVK